MKMKKCPECNFTGSLEDFIQDTNPPAGNSGCWCPVCDLSVEIVNGEVCHYIDAQSLNIAMGLLSSNFPQGLN